jgi:NADH:ubiquinone oxidoreductase subunit C
MVELFCKNIIVGFCYKVRFVKNSYYLNKFVKNNFLVNLIYNILKNYFSLIFISDKYINIIVKRDKYMLKSLKVFKFFSFFSFKQLLDIVGVDLLEINAFSSYRYELIYVLNSVRYNLRIFLRAFVNQFGYYHSVTSLYKSSN